MGYTTSSAQTERNFGKAGLVSTGKQNRLDVEFFGMFFGLNANYALIPSFASEIKYSVWNEKIPRGLVAMDESAVLKRGPPHNGEDNDVSCGL